MNVHDDARAPYLFARRLRFYRHGQAVRALGDGPRRHRAWLRVLVSVQARYQERVRVERARLPPDVRQDERVEVGARIAGLRPAAARLRVSRAGRLRPGAAAQDEHVPRVRVLRNLPPHDLTQVVHPGRRDREYLNAPVRRVLDVGRVVEVLRVIEVWRRVADQEGVASQRVGVPVEPGQRDVDGLVDGLGQVAAAARANVGDGLLERRRVIGYTLVT